MVDPDPMQAFLDAQRKTHIVRARQNLLFTFGATRLPYVFLADSAVNRGDVVMRRGEVTVAPPRIIAPRDPVELEGFGLEEMEEGVIPVLLNRWVRFPAATYQNTGGALEVVDGPMPGAVERVVDRLDSENDSRTGVIQGPEDRWGFSVLGYVGQMIARSAPSNIGEYFERFGLNGPDGIEE